MGEDPESVVTEAFKQLLWLLAIYLGIAGLFVTFLLLGGWDPRPIPDPYAPALTIPNPRQSPNQREARP